MEISKANLPSGTQTNLLLHGQAKANVFSKHADLLLGLAVLSLMAPPAAQAYLDPNAGSYAMQVLFASLFAGMYSLKKFFACLRNKFQKQSVSDTGKAKSLEKLPGDFNYTTLF